MESLQKTIGQGGWHLFISSGKSTTVFPMRAFDILQMPSIFKS